MNKDQKRSAIILAVISFCIIVLPIFFFIRTQQREQQKETPPRNSVEVDIHAVYNEVNHQRHLAGAPLLAMNPSLIESAKAKCNDMVQGDYYEHQNPTTHKKGGQYVYEFLPGATLASENLNMGIFVSSEAVVSDSTYGWIASAPHKATMLDPQYTDTGIAACRIPSAPAEMVVVEHFAVVPK